MARWNIAIKIGTLATSIFLSGNGIVLNEPTVIAFSGDKKNRRIRAVGNEAYKMLGKSSDSTTVVSPVVDGIIADRELATLYLRELLAKLISSQPFKPRLDAILAVPTGLTLDERRMYEDVCFRAGIASVTLVDSILLAAIGTDLPIDASIGRLVVNIGAGMTEMGVISLCSVVTGCSINVGGNMIDRSLVDYIAGHYNLRISTAAARDVKNKIASLYSNDRSKIKITGLDLDTNNLSEAEILAYDVTETIKPYYIRIIEALEGIINVCPPDIAADINRVGIYITGGGSRVLGIEGMFSTRLGLKVNLSDEPQYATIMGAGKLLSNDNLLNEILKQR